LEEWECVEVKHHKDVPKTIDEYQRKGWRLHSYQTAGMGAGPMSYVVNHYFYFFDLCLDEVENEEENP